MPAATPGPDPRSTMVQLEVIADGIERQRDRVASLAEPFLGTDRDDVVSSVHEAERELLRAVRALRRAINTLDR